MKRFLSVILFALIAVFSLTFGIVEDGFVSLIPTENVKWVENAQANAGWIKYGGEATFEVEGDHIVGKRGSGYSTFLCTEKRYTNFIFKCEMKFDIGSNSGIQFRSHIKPGKFDDKDISVVFGYQCESDPRPTEMNAFIFDESRRGWLNGDTPENHEKSAAAFKKDDWNEYTIQCVGSSIKTWLNGKLIADFVDVEDNEGFFGLQMHSGAQGQVRWRNIRIKELPATP
jgi:hypothetical protein